MEPIFDSPMAAHGLGGQVGGERRRRDLGARLEAAAIGKLGARLDSDNAGGVRQSQLAGKAPVAGEPTGFLHDADSPLLEAAMALVAIDEPAEGRRVSDGEEAFRPGAHCRLVALTASR